MNLCVRVSSRLFISVCHCRVEHKRGRIPRMKGSSIIPIALALALMGCYGATRQVSEHRYPPTALGSVQVLYQEPKRSYEVLAFVNHRDTVTLSLSNCIAA